MSFRISPLNADDFNYLHTLSPEQLDEQNIVVRVADSDNGYPYRVSLKDAKAGDELYLFNYEHLPVESPYRSRHAIYVNKNATPADPKRGEIPQQLRSRLIAVRGFDQEGTMLEAEISEGTELEAAIDATFNNQDVEYIHLHFAKPGCYAARVDRA